MKLDKEKFKRALLRLDDNLQILISEKNNPEKVSKRINEIRMILDGAIKVIEKSTV